MINIIPLVEIVAVLLNVPDIELTHEARMPANTTQRHLVMNLHLGRHRSS